MIRFSGCKINIGLFIIDKRNDGFHNIQTVFYPVAFLSDAIEIIESETPNDAYFLTGLAISDPIEENVCYKAVKMLRADFYFPSIELHLHKVVPMGAGLGGGSANASATLCLINDLFNLNLSDAELQNYASKLGADCAFFVKQVPQIGEGKGEVLSPIDLDLSGKYLLVVKPNIHISTAEAYKNIRLTNSSIDLKSAIKTPIYQWKSRLANDFERSVFEKHPEISGLKESLYHAGAIYAQMSGSGAASYGIFNEKPDFQNLPDGWTSFVGIL